MSEFKLLADYNIEKEHICHCFLSGYQKHRRRWRNSFPSIGVLIDISFYVKCVLCWIWRDVHSHRLEGFRGLGDLAFLWALFVSSIRLCCFRRVLFFVDCSSTIVFFFWSFHLPIDRIDLSSTMCFWVDLWIDDVGIHVVPCQMQATRRRFIWVSGCLAKYPTIRSRCRVMIVSRVSICSRKKCLLFVIQSYHVFRRIWRPFIWWNRSCVWMSLR